MNLSFKLPLGITIQRRTTSLTERKWIKGRDFEANCTPDDDSRVIYNDE